MVISNIEHAVSHGFKLKIPRLWILREVRIWIFGRPPTMSIECQPNIVFSGIFLWGKMYFWGHNIDMP